jgi:hypothetical protein
MYTTHIDVVPLPTSALDASGQPVTEASVARGSRNPVGWFIFQLVGVVAASAVLGGVTSYAQTFLPDALRSFANSASGWTLLTVLVVLACRARTAPSAFLGGASFVALVLGYQMVSGLRGYPTSETLFLIIGIIVGPFVGVAASWLRREGWRAALGCAALSGIAVGEAIYGLALLSDTTGWVYWTLVGAIGIGLLVFTVLRRLHTVRTRLLAITLVPVVGAAFFFAYWAAGSMQLPF